MAKFRHLAKLARLGQKLTVAQKATQATRAFAGTVEISSGTIRILLKLTGVEDEPWAQDLQEVLFYLELISLGAEVTNAIGKGLLKSVDNVLSYEDALLKTAKNVDEAKQLDEAIKELKKTANYKIDNFIKNGVKNGRAIGKINKKTIIRELGTSISGKRASKALKDGEVKLIKLDEVEFRLKAKETSEAGEDVSNVTAFQFENEIFLLNDAPLDRAFGEIVHEVQHVLDEASGLLDNVDELRKQTKLITHDGVSMKKFVDRMTDGQVFELRARIAEREFQLEVKTMLDFKSVEVMISVYQIIFTCSTFLLTALSLILVNKFGSTSKKGLKTKRFKPLKS